MTASGFSSRCLRARSVATAAGERASQARWKPPMPFTATILPVGERRPAATRASSRSARTRPSPLEERQAGAAGRAGVRLGVEAPVGRVVVLAPAGLRRA